MNRLSGRVLMYVGSCFLVGCLGAVILGILGAIRASHTVPNNTSSRVTAGTHGLQSTSAARISVIVPLSDEQRAIDAVKAYRPGTNGATVGETVNRMAKSFAPADSLFGWNARLHDDLWLVRWSGKDKTGNEHSGSWRVRLSDPVTITESDDLAKQIDKDASGQANARPSGK